MEMLTIASGARRMLSTIKTTLAGDIASVSYYHLVLIFINYPVF